MKKLTIKEIKNEFIKWNGTEWDTLTGKYKLIGYDEADNEMYLFFIDLMDDVHMFELSECTPIEPLFEGWLNVNDFGEIVDDNYPQNSRRIKVREVRDE